MYYTWMMQTPTDIQTGLLARVASYPLLSALRERRSRRFGLGMKMPGGPLAYVSRHPAVALTESEEATLVFAACGVTGHALADLCYSADGGGSIMAGMVARHGELASDQARARYT